jgi:adenosylcobinamide-GDP ribazoletransferase
MRELLGFIEAIGFLTIIPMPSFNQEKPTDIGRALTFFPLIGLGLGAILLLLNWLLSFVFSSQVIFALLVAALVILTGAHHVDGLADTFDGLVSGKTQKQRLAILSDNKVGAFGIAALVLILLLKFAALNSNPMIVPTLLLMPVLSRWMMVSSMFIAPSARKSGMGFAFKQGATRGRFIAACIITAIISFAVLGWHGLLLMAMVWITASLVALFFSWRFGGLTGDNYGAINEISEVLALLLIVVVFRFFR